MLGMPNIEVLPALKAYRSGVRGQALPWQALNEIMALPYETRVLASQLLTLDAAAGDTRPSTLTVARLALRTEAYRPTCRKRAHVAGWHPDVKRRR
jgi:hypothetical protein